MTTFDEVLYYARFLDEHSLSFGRGIPLEFYIFHGTSRPGQERYLIPIYKESEFVFMVMVREDYTPEEIFHVINNAVCFLSPSARPHIKLYETKERRIKL